MKNEKFKTPILLLIFNRYETTRLVFEEIRNIKPDKLYIAADGPRPWIPEDKNNCRMARSIIELIDWKCEVKTLFRDVNMGCKRAVSSAISWFFNNEETGIILEDDCLPHRSFFAYCQELLEYYKNDTRIMMISGNNFQDGKKRGSGSYYFSQYAHIWGWASWRRAWELYDVNMKEFVYFNDNNIVSNVFPLKSDQRHWMKCFNLVYEGLIDTWDYQWVYAIISNNAVSIMPNVNLVSNIGFGENSTHTKNVKHKTANIERNSIEKIIHPMFVLLDRSADMYESRDLRMVNKILNRIKKYLLKYITI